MFHTLPEALRAGGHPPVPLFVPLIFATLLATFKLPKWKETTFFVLQVTELFKPMDRMLSAKIIHNRHLTATEINLGSHPIVYSRILPPSAIDVKKIQRLVGTN